MRIELQLTDDEGSVLAVDGRRATAQTLSWLDGLAVPHPLVWLRGERLYDVELWVAGVFVGYVPSPSGEVDAAYEAAERRSA